MTSNIGVAVVGDVLDINTWSNTPYYFYAEGNKQNLFNQPWRLNTNQFKPSRIFWNLGRMITGQGTGGYQYSESFLKKAEGSIPPAYFNSTVITFNQVFPRASSIKNSGGRLFYYIDTTLHELFRAASYGIDIPQDMREKALELEAENYKHASAIVCMAAWVRESLVDFYKINPEKIFVILPGANLPTDISVPNTSFRPGAGIDRDVVLGFVGKDWKRKGLPVLVEVRDLLEQRGYKAIVKVIGNAPPELTQKRGVKFSGFIDKGRDHQRFVEEIASCDFGCLFSSSEALGISVLEFLRVGVPVVGYAHQGSLDTMIPNASLRFNVGDNAEVIVDRLVQTITNENEMRRLKSEAIKVAPDVSWANTVRQWSNLLTKMQ